MPVMDGVTCTRHIREYENAQNIQNKVPIIALTGTRRAPPSSCAIVSGFRVLTQLLLCVTQPTRHHARGGSALRRDAMSTSRNRSTILFWWIP